MNSPTTTTMIPMNNLSAQLEQVGLRALPANLVRAFLVAFLLAVDDR
jgi:hypothetical protein